MKIGIKSRYTGYILFTGEYPSIRDALQEAIKSRTNLCHANLSRADLSRADLSRTNLSHADLSGANLSGANLSRADLSRADLSRADLSHADLFGANLFGANLSRADLSRADLSGALLDSKYCFLSISPIGSENGCLWTMKNEEGILKYNRGCFSGTEEEFVAAVKKKHGGTEYEKKYLAAVDFINEQLSLTKEEYGTTAIE